MRTTFRRRFASTRRRARWLWIRGATAVPSPNATLNNSDPLAGYRTNAGITINLPEFTIWRIKIRVSINITIAAAAGANDGILFTAFTDSMSQTPVNQLANSWDQRHLMYTNMYLSKYISSTNESGAAGTYYMYEEFDLKSHRKMHQLNDTLFLQFASTGQAVQTDISYTYSILCRQSPN